MRGHDRRNRWLVAVLITVGLGATGCATTESAASAGGPQEAPPAKVEPIAGKDVSSVTLSDHAAKRLGVDTTELAAAPQGTTVPYSAVFYTPDGTAWVYTMTQPLTF